MVLENHHAAVIFEKYGLDFCCRGNQTLDIACKERSLSAEKVAQELLVLPDSPSGMREQQWDIPFLIDYIVNVHHSYIREILPTLRDHLGKVMRVHGHRHPELLRVGQLFQSTTEDLEDHLLKEEAVLFPYIKELSAGRKPKMPFGSVRNPIAAMVNEHEQAGDTFAEIKVLLQNYQPPQDACTTMRVLYKELQEFEEDLHQHVFLENSILFPKASAKETEVFEK